MENVLKLVGNIISDSDYLISDYIKVQPGTIQITGSPNGTPSDYCVHSIVYDKNLNPNDYWGVAGANRY